MPSYWRVPRVALSAAIAVDSSVDGSDMSFDQIFLCISQEHHRDSAWGMCFSSICFLAWWDLSTGARLFSTQSRLE